MGGAEVTTRVTMKEVAAAAGVSTKTVSNVLRGTGSASPYTRQRVLDAAAQLGYEVNAAAASLRSGKRGTVALAIPTLQQPIFARLASELMRVAPIPVLLELTGGRADREHALLAGSWRAQCDALVMVPRSIDPTQESFLTHTTTEGLILITEDGPTPIPRVACSPAAQAVLVAGHLHECGARSAAVLGIDVPADRWTHHCVQGLRAAGLAVPEQAIIHAPADEGMRAGVEAVTRLLYAGPRVDALVCHNDALAAGAAATLMRRGLRVPEDVIVIGRGDTETARYAAPNLTSVNLGLDAVAAHIVHFLTHPDEPARTIEVPPSLAIRESSTHR